MANEWIRLNRSAESTRFFFFPFSGGTAQVFKPFAALLPPDAGCYSLELPGRGRRFCDEPYGSITEIVNEAISTISPLIGNLPYYFFGHSLGAMIAFELAREMRRKKIALPSHIFVSGARAPQVVRRERNCHDLGHDEFIKKIREMGGTPEEIFENKEMLEIILPVLRKDFKAFETYKYIDEDPLNTPITSIGGLSDKFVTENDISEWGHHTTGYFSSHMIEGDHFFILSKYTELTEIMQRNIARSRSGYA
jgi:medium-chain acyl-[acyl-carrier-protein] hydrolase